jgi:hypothetical protein
MTDNIAVLVREVRAYAREISHSDLPSYEFTHLITFISSTQQTDPIAM